MLFNYIFDNDIVFYSLFTCTAGFMGYSLITSYLDSFYVDKGIQTDAWEDYSNRPSQIASDSLTSIDTVTPRFSPTDYVNTGPQINTIEAGTQTITDNMSTVTTVLPIPPIQKAGVVVGSGIAAGFGHTLLSSINKKAVTAENTFPSVESSTNSQVKKFFKWFSFKSFTRFFI